MSAFPPDSRVMCVSDMHYLTIVFFFVVVIANVNLDYFPSLSPPGTQSRPITYNVVVNEFMFRDISISKYYLALLLIWFFFIDFVCCINHTVSFVKFTVNLSLQTRHNKCNTANNFECIVAPALLLICDMESLVIISFTETKVLKYSGQWFSFCINIVHTYKNGLNNLILIIPFLICIGTDSPLFVNACLVFDP